MSVEALCTVALDRLADLRGAAYAGEIGGRGGHLHGALFCDLDDAQGATVAMAFASEAGGPLTLDVRVTGRPRWVVLRLELGSGAVRAGERVGVVLQGWSSRPTETGVYLRAVRNGGFADARFPEPIALGPQQATRVALATLESGHPVCAGPAGYALVLGLAPVSHRLRIDGLHLLAGAAAGWAPEGP
ncbi:hypothetical protein [Rubellimicrobium sp. CFH 75288]|uniref:hypothetical protein n=1 Tax=Rubellimicrobium sp. CFH 75288 TaxID=2697034 RepID=UPI001411DC23|nr:hypothetical protein [Rubellimicrobium sp. CFH 75288]NAZ36874.1 hypothetical protein [Rubellimicrobium sp. CFH 75288]